jgi:cytidine deaminase
MDEKTAIAAPQAQPQYGLEVLCASWNPLVTAIAEPVGACREFVAELATIDVEGFLSSFYRSQQG